MAATIRIALLLYPRCMPAGLFAFADLLHAANRRAGQPLFEPVFAALDAGAVVCAHGQVLHAAAALGRMAPDAVLLPGFWGESQQQVTAAVEKNAALAAALAALPEKTQAWSYCTGVCLLAESGRLGNGDATVTWWLADAMRLRHPKVRWRQERTCVFAPRTATASGVNGYLPIAQALIEKHLSVDAYRELTRLMVLPRPERTHSVFHAMNLAQQPDRLLRQLYAEAERMPANEATVARLARQLNASERTLARKVAAAAGMPAAAYIRRVKLNQVSERLIQTAAPASTISAELGFSSDAAMRRMFRELTGMAPGAYRRAFGRG